MATGGGTRGSLLRDAEHETGLVGAEEHERPRREVGVKGLG